MAHITKSLVKAILSQSLSGVIKYLNDDTTLSFLDPTGIIPYAGRFEGLKGVKEFIELFKTYVKVLSVRGKTSVNGKTVIYSARVVQKNRLEPGFDLHPHPFKLRLIFSVELDKCCRVKKIEIVSDSTALALFYQYPQTNGPVYNKYKIMMDLGLDEYFAGFPFLENAAAIEKFHSVFGMDDAQISQLRDASIQYFNEEFGINFTGAPYDPVTWRSELPKGGWATLYPIYTGFKYRVFQSTNIAIPVLDPNDPPLNQLVEFVVGFNIPDGEIHYFGGNYATQYGSEILIGNNNNAAYGIYMIDVKKDVFGPARTFKFFMRSMVPGWNDPTDLVNEWFQFNSQEFGAGAGTIQIALGFDGPPETPIAVRYRANWSFPGSNVIPRYNTFTEAPYEL